MIGRGIDKVRVEQDIDIWKQQLRSGILGSELKLVFGDVERARPVKVYTAPRASAPNRNEPKWRLGRRLAAFKRIVQCLGDERAYA